MKKILVGVPYYDHIEPEAEESLRKLQEYGCDVFRKPSCHLPMTRNDMAQHMRSNGYDYILYHDSDISITIQGLELLLALDKPVVTGLCAMMKNNVIRWAIGLNKVENSYTYLTGEITNPMPVAACGAACLLVKNEVFKGVEWPWFDFELLPSKAIRGEDFSFSDKCNKNGYEVWLEPRAIANHYKKINITGLVYYGKKCNI